MTDIVGSTPRWAAARESMSAAVLQHDEIFAEVVAAHHGKLLKPRGEGDSTFSVFDTVRHAVAAAWAIHHRMISMRWPTESPLQLRTAIHCGEAEERDEDIYGDLPNRCGRMRSVAHPGQILISQAAVGLHADALPKGAHLVDLGEHRLRDLLRSEKIFEISVEGWTLHPPLLSLDTVDHNLPIQSDRFVGRVAELAQVLDQLREHTLVTLTGPGGTGKTRLAMQVAAETAGDYSGGVRWVRLESLRLGDDIAGAIADQIGLPEGARTLAHIAVAVKDRNLLLVLDNGERLREPLRTLIQALRNGAPGLRILVTSREPIGFTFESTVRVPPLSLPPLDSHDHELLASDAGQLFLDRVRQHDPSVQVTAENAAIIAAICHRLDGLPLALQLAAARVSSLDLQNLRRRLDRGLALLRSDFADHEQRQLTVRATVVWSLDLLTEPERDLFRDFCLFRASFDLNEAEAVDGDTDGAFLDRLESLVRKSLVMVEDHVDGRAYRLLQTYRETGRETLGEISPLARSRLVQHYVALSQAHKDRLPARREGRANETALCDALLNAADPRALEIALMLREQWHRFGPLVGAIERLQQALSLAPDAPAESRGVAMNLIGVLSWLHGDYASAGAAYQAAIAIFDAEGNSVRAAFTRVNQGILLAFTGDLAGGYAALRPAIEALDAAQQDDAAMNARISLGRVLEGLGRCDEAISVLTIALDQADRLGDDLGRQLGRQRALQNRSTAYFELEQWAHGRADMEVLMSLMPEAPDPTILADLILQGAHLAFLAGQAAESLTFIVAFRAAYQRLERPPSHQQANQADHWERLCRSELSERDVNDALAVGPTLTWPEVSNKMRDFASRDR